MKTSLVKSASRIVGFLLFFELAFFTLWFFGPSWSPWLTLAVGVLIVLALVTDSNHNCLNQELIDRINKEKYHG